MAAVSFGRRRAGRQTMKLREDIDIIAFLKSVKKCRKDVYFCSAEGDRLNLKSDLCQYVLAVSMKDQRLIRAGTVECDDAEDGECLRAFLIEAGRI